MTTVERMAISRTPLREALKVLVAEGLLRHEPRRGCFVAAVTERDLDEITDDEVPVPMFHVPARSSLGVGSWLSWCSSPGRWTAASPPSLSRWTTTTGPASGSG